jgi:hypothetical protein
MVPEGSQEPGAESEKSEGRRGGGVGCQGGPVGGTKGRRLAFRRRIRPGRAAALRPTAADERWLDRQSSTLLLRSRRLQQKASRRGEMLHRKASGAREEGHVAQESRVGTTRPAPSALVQACVSILIPPSLGPRPRAARSRATPPPARHLAHSPTRNPFTRPLDSHRAACYACDPSRQAFLA